LTLAGLPTAPELMVFEDKSLDVVLIAYISEIIDKFLFIVLEFSNFETDILDLLGLFVATACISKLLDIEFKFQIFTDPIFLLGDEGLNPIFEGIQQFLLLAFLLLPLVEFHNDLPVLLAVFLLLELFEAVVEGQLFLLWSLLLVEQVFEFVEVGVFLLAVVFHADGVVQLGRD
jgi:hypothetical protein